MLLPDSFQTRPWRSSGRIAEELFEALPPQKDHYATGAPEVVTGNAEVRTNTEAVAAGTLNPNGQDTTWYFEYGTPLPTAMATPATHAGSGTETVHVETKLADLSPGTNYHYRLVATSDGGTTRGNDQMFATLGVTF